MSNCTQKYDMGVYNNETGQVEDISYPCERDAGHEEESPHKFTLNGREYPWFDAEQIKRLQKRGPQAL